MNKQQFNSRYKPQYNNFFSMVHNIGPDLNSRKNRFDKSDLIEKAFAASTKGRLIWKDEIGYDLVDKKGLKYEVKSCAFSIYTEKGTYKQKTKDLKLTNTLQNSVNNKKLTKTADYLIIIDTGSYCAALIDYQTVIDKYSTELSDGFSCKIPTSELTLLISPSDVQLKLYENISRYSDVKTKAQNDYVAKFF